MAATAKIKASKDAIFQFFTLLGGSHFSRSVERTPHGAMANHFIEVLYAQSDWGGSILSIISLLAYF